MALMTTVALPVIRRPTVLAKALGALDLLSGGRVIAGVGPGSSARDYEAVDVPFEERWQRFDESVGALRSLWNPDSPPFIGQFYDTQDMRLEPPPAQKSGPPIWIGSWGSDAGLRRVARLADGWLASGYNTTPMRFAAALESLRHQLAKHGKDAERFPNAIATMWFYVTDDRAEAMHMLRDVLVPTLQRDEDELRARLPIGPPEDCAHKLAAYRDKGAGRILLWPLADEVEQITRFMEQVAPLLDG
jgi:alkanesulfonate monooxygenase SsuD/methylene tetrahydromethanopterin reductase-like flavin-dependent oxidoreductase (luciferase family)